jgi:hypothetical protein
MKTSVFVEDAAHASFIVGVLERVALTLGVSIDVNVRNAVGGHGAVVGSLRRYVRDVARGRDTFAEVLVVAIDGNCQGSHRVKRAIREVAQREVYPGLVVCAVPNPHIELWYLLDGIAVNTVIGCGGSQPALPEQKCEKGRYKRLLRDAFREGDIDPPAGGSEYGEEIAAALDIDFARAADSDFDSFVDDLEAALRSSAD